ncbi:fluoride efflux transporter CrcB [Ancylomarina euxinus]|uniref:Fluoride-specific ion channel FluC n=1 Tax=Ancylomarina euxinus TaxID=2283627 RepID=A0A425Y3G4_9BACT|nr:fluoride efflux transporter CrcB [Ancylomarina euxinus]MCZ4693078.1 fluoride efflux transporter CrcB [Ancylomarina euxinus]MUP15215.1 fluoride efflux transporter CrcB [Ancylomarina euxinus]RRG22655.1 fluoride efflux transporter CrcB [Ancylomarina euxinus]
MLRTLLLIGLGGFLGSISRFLIALGVNRIFQSVLPVGTLAVNILGCLLIGIIYSLAEQKNMLSPELRIFLGVGFCGGFTTYSSFAFDKFGLIKAGDFLMLSVYVGASVFLGLLAVYLGSQIHKLF